MLPHRPEKPPPERRLAAKAGRRGVVHCAGLLANRWAIAARATRSRLCLYIEESSSSGSPAGFCAHTLSERPAALGQPLGSARRSRRPGCFPGPDLGWISSWPRRRLAGRRSSRQTRTDSDRDPHPFGQPLLAVLAVAGQQAQKRFRVQLRRMSRWRGRPSLKPVHRAGPRPMNPTRWRGVRAVGLTG